MKKRFLLLLAFLILLGTGNFFSSRSFEKEAPSIVLENSYLGEIESLIEYGDHSVIAAHYPVFSIDNIDLITKELIDKYMLRFKKAVKGHSVEDKNYKSELNIDYETHKGPNDIVSVEFTILENISHYPNPNIIIETRAYDLEKDLPITLDDIMTNKYLNKISELTIDYFRNDDVYKNSTLSKGFENSLRPAKRNYSTFLLLEDRITFIFQKYEVFPGSFGIPIVEIPYLDILDYLKPSFANRIQKPVFSLAKEELPIDNPSPDSNIQMVNSLRKIYPLQPMVALTFDDGPNAKSTIPILDTLEEHNAVATFFIVGNRVASNKAIIQRMVNEGNEIGNHSFNHKQLTKLTSSELKSQINRTQNEVLKVVGSKPKVMRPTYGSHNNRIRSLVEMPMILWSIDTMDWKYRDAEKIIFHVLDNVKDGDIILMHDIYESTVDAVDYLVPALINQGYQLVTVSELFEIRGEVLEVGNIYSGFKSAH